MLSLKAVARPFKLKTSSSTDNTSPRVSNMSPDVNSLSRCVRARLQKVKRSLPQFSATAGASRRRHYYIFELSNHSEISPPWQPISGS
jgi:hypothetical protein